MRYFLIISTLIVTNMFAVETPFGDYIQGSQQAFYYFDAVTIGRTDLTKNPFLLHKKLANSDKISCVLTNEENFQHSLILDLDK